LIPGGRSPIPGFASRGRKRGTCTRGAGVGSRAEGQRSPTAGQAAMAVSLGEGGGGLSQEGRWGAPGNRGSRAAAWGCPKEECQTPCFGPTAALPLLHAPGPAPGPAPGAVVPVRGKGVGAEGRRFPTAGWLCQRRRAGAVGPRTGMMAGLQGQAALEDQERNRSACDWCLVVRIRAPGAATPRMVTVRPPCWSTFGLVFYLAP
jgi:hypothetical protein